MQDTINDSKEKYSKIKSYITIFFEIFFLVCEVAGFVIGIAYLCKNYSKLLPL